jgi:hypothetical protein
MEDHDLIQTRKKLKGPTPEQIIFHNQWAAVAFDRFHTNSQAVLNLSIDGSEQQINLKWDSNFQKAAMREEKHMADHGGVALAWFIMSVILDFGYVQQSEIGEGVDYRFRKLEPDDDDLNFLDDYHHVEISGILEEKGTNTLNRRIKEKHSQIQRGTRSHLPSSVLVTLFEQPRTVKEIHN